MTRHPPDPSCQCDFCYVADLNAVLRRFAERRRTVNPTQRYGFFADINNDFRDSDHPADLANAGLADELQRGRG